MMNAIVGFVAMQPYDRPTASSAGKQPVQTYIVRICPGGRKRRAYQPLGCYAAAFNLTTVRLACNQKPVRTEHIDIKIELIPKYLRTIFEIRSTSNMVG